MRFSPSHKIIFSLVILKFFLVRDEQTPAALVSISESLCDTLTTRFDNTLTKKSTTSVENYTIFYLIGFYVPKIEQVCFLN